MASLMITLLPRRSVSPTVCCVAVGRRSKAPVEIRKERGRDPKDVFNKGGLLGELKRREFSERAGPGTTETSRAQRPGARSCLSKQHGQKADIKSPKTGCASNAQAADELSDSVIHPARPFPPPWLANRRRCPAAPERTTEPLWIRPAFSLRPILFERDSSRSIPRNGAGAHSRFGHKAMIGFRSSSPAMGPSRFESRRRRSGLRVSEARNQEFGQYAFAASPVRARPWLRFSVISLRIS